MTAIIVGTGGVFALGFGAGLITAAIVLHCVVAGANAAKGKAK